MRRKISIVYKILVICLLATGILLNTMKTISIISLLSYYTLQSNIICLIAFIYFVYLEITKKERTNKYYLIKGAITIAIFITIVVYTIALLPNQFEMDFFHRTAVYKTIANLLVHIISPILIIMDYFFFDKKGNLKNSYIGYWLIIPLSYMTYVYLYSYFGGRFYNIGGSRKFAYFFLDYEKIGYIGIAKWILLITISIILVSHLFVYIDSKLSK